MRKTLLATLVASSFFATVALANPPAETPAADGTPPAGQANTDATGSAHAAAGHDQHASDQGVAASADGQATAAAASGAIEVDEEKDDEEDVADAPAEAEAEADTAAGDGDDGSR